jgi:penicillin amidase
MRKSPLRPLVLLLLLPCTQVFATEFTEASTRRLGVGAPAQIIRDTDGVSHIFATTERDLLFLQGYVQARDRLFQMDTLRRQADGTLGELLGSPALPSDIQLRTIGIRRAAEVSVPALSKETRAGLRAYAEGVNAYAMSHPLPPEYQRIEVTRFRPWTDVDSVSIFKLLTFQLSFELSELQATVALRSYQAAGAQRGFDGTKLFLEDAVRFAPFDSAATIPDAMQRPVKRRDARTTAPLDSSYLEDATLELARDYLDKLRAAPFAEGAMKTGDGDRGSNQFVVAGRFSVTGQPLIANDPHLVFTAPSILYNVHLDAPLAGIEAVGATLPGAPYIVLGNNERLSWALTTNPLDITDVYQERIVSDSASPSGLSTVYQGTREHVVALPQVFRANVVGDGINDNLNTVPAGGAVPAAVLIVPRRNMGPIVSFDPANGVAFSVQYAGFGATREVDAFRRLTRARNQAEFVKALQFFDVGSQNFAYADVEGNIAYYSSGELPLREDLEAGAVVGLPPMFVRNGEGGNEWVKARGRDEFRSLPFEILPWAEMPHIVNPPRGFIVNSNNDVTGTSLDNDPFNERRPNGGILYFSSGYSPGARASRITELLAERIAKRGRLTTQDLKEIQADTVMRDARYFTPAITTAFANARKVGAHPALAQLAADPRIAEAVGRLAAWDQSTPTGIRQGFDANDSPRKLREPDAQEIRHSVAATIYSVWRNQFLADTVDATLRRNGVTVFNPVGRAFGRREILSAARNLLDNFDARAGIGASGVNFFEVPGIADAATRRDFLLLNSVGKALDKLAGDAYATAFKRSTNQDDYRWGMLHRVTFNHPLGAMFPEFNIPPAGGAFPAPLGPTLPGIPVDGGFETVDVANNAFLVDSPDAFIILGGASQRYVARARLTGKGFDAETALPGGQSGVPGNRFYVNLLEEWLTNDTHPLRQNRVELLFDSAQVETILPARR